MIIRILDFFLSLIGLIFIFPLLFFIAIIIKLDSKGTILFKQTRVGKNNVDFTLYKFRTMHLNSEERGQITIGNRDKRITRAGLILRKYKLDELPQLFNVLKGEMSLVGPRPEVRKYVNMYNEYQMKVLTVKPGITDYASIKFKNENQLLALIENPEYLYVNTILPQKIELNLLNISNPSIKNYFKIIFLTLLNIFKS